MCQLECSVTQDFEGAWDHLQIVRNVHFRQYCNAYELLLETICYIRIAHSPMNLYFYNANFDG